MSNDKLNNSVSLLRTPLENSDPAEINSRFLALGDIMMNGFLEIKTDFTKIETSLNTIKTDLNENLKSNQAELLLKQEGISMDLKEFKSEIGLSLSEIINQLQNLSSKE